MTGMKIVTNSCLTETKFVLHQHDRFVEYEKKDEGWLARLGMGHFEQRPRREIIRVGDSIVMHPAIYEEFIRIMGGSCYDRRRTGGD